jgi:23S rRNA pseudouridine2605 synthase
MLLNKPRGVVSTLDDPEGRRTIADFLTKQYLSYFPVGRLDFDSTGLMILTNDGDLAERLMHPRYEFERTYHARVEGHLNAELLAKLPRGIRLSDGMVHGSGEIIKNDEKTTWVEVKVREGRNRVVRRLFEKLGHAVMKLKRLTYGPFKLGKLQVGQIRVLTQEEYMLVRHKVLTSVGGETEKKAKKPGRETGATRAAGPGREGQKGRATTERPKSRPRRGSSQRRRRE